MSMSLTDLTHCFFVAANGRHPSRPTMVDMIHPDTGKGVYGGRTLEEVREEYPNAEEMHIDKATALTNDFYRTPPMRTTKQAWQDALDVLPPRNYVVQGSTASFKMSEMLCGDITRVYCRLGENYFYFNGEVRLTHDAIVEMCADALKEA